MIPTTSSVRDSISVQREAWELLRRSVVTYKGEPVGTVASYQPGDVPVNYDQVFARDFVSPALAFMGIGEFNIVAQYLRTIASQVRTEEVWTPGVPSMGLMPASFKVVQVNRDEEIQADFGDRAIGRVPPVDSGLWWILLLDWYTECSGDRTLVDDASIQKVLEAVLKLYCHCSFDLTPALLVSDGACMIDRRLSISGFFLELQSVLCWALKSAQRIYVGNNKELALGITQRLASLQELLRTQYWIDRDRINEMYLAKNEEYGLDAKNIYNVFPDGVPLMSLLSWLPAGCGYLAGNVGVSLVDTRFFALGNLVAIAAGVLTNEQGHALLSLYEHRWSDLVGEIPLKISWPAMEGNDHRLLLGADDKNSPWSYHNGGNWPVLSWFFAVACNRLGRQDLLKKVVGLLEEKLPRDQWQEYYCGPDGSLRGKRSRACQTWSIAAYLLAHQSLSDSTITNLVGGLTHSNHNQNS
jgi:glycogen debranching enzyme